MKQLIYLAQPIDQVGTRQNPRMRRLREIANALLDDARVTVFDPSKAYRQCPYTMPQRRKLEPSELDQIDTINRAALDACAGLFAILPMGTPTLGTPVEIERSLAAGKPTVLLVDGDLARTSAQVISWRRAGAIVLSEDAYGANEGDAHAAVVRAFNSPPPVDERQVMQYKLTDPAAVVPHRAYSDDAGFDLSVCEAASLAPGESGVIRTGFSAALPPGTWGLIIGRSSTWAKRRLLVHLGVIDVGWRGDLFVSVTNHSGEPVKIEPGERLAQYIVLPAWQGRLMEAVGELPPHDRGTNGFGSSGL